MKVFVVVSQVEYGDYPCTNFCEGVKTTMESAVAMANDLLDKKIKLWVEKFKNVESENDIEVSRLDKTGVYSLRNTINNIDYFRVDIYEREVEE